jgi:hypothetical protein
MKTSKPFLVVGLVGLMISLSAPAFAGKAPAWSFGQGGQGNGPIFGGSNGRGVLGGLGQQNGRMSLTQIAAGLVPLMQVLETINSQEPGTQLDTNTVQENGRTIYVVRWQASRGRIIIFRVDAETGQIIGRQS